MGFHHPWKFQPVRCHQNFTNRGWELALATGDQVFGMKI
jgi:hypothetical protein